MNQITQRNIVKVLMPAILFYGAYQAITYKEPSNEQTPSETAHISARLRPFLDALGIRKDLKIKEKNTLNFAEAFGTNCSISGDAAIHVAQGFYPIDPNASSFVLKHEICHLKNNDKITACALALSSIVAALFLTSSCEDSLSANIVAFAGATTLISSMYYQETLADNFAIANSSIDELKGGRRIFKAIQQLYVEARPLAGWKKWLISPNGENQIDFIHPSLTSRIKKIESSVKAKNGIIHAAHEQEKIEKIKIFFKNIHRKISH